MMSVNPFTELSDTVPLAAVPIRSDNLAAVANEYTIDAKVLAETLEEIQEHLSEYAVDIHERYTSEWGDNAIILDAVIWEAVYVYQDEWNELRDRLDIDGDLYVPAREYHLRETSRLIDEVEEAESVDYLRTNDYLIMPTPLVARLMDAGLSRQQALVQALRMAGNSQEDIGNHLGNATGTVKSHCDRIDQKIERARKLLALVGKRDNSPLNNHEEHRGS